MKRKTIKKCIKVFSVKIDSDTFNSIDNLFQKYGRCKNDFFQLYGGIKSIIKIQNAKDLRTEIRKTIKTPLENKYNFQNRHWVMALFDACSNLKSAWSNLANKLKKEIMGNDNLSQKEKSYLCYIVSVKELWYQLLNYEDFNISNMKKFNKLKNDISDSRFCYLHNYLRRITRKYKFRKPHSEITNCISLDEVMYKIIEEGDETFISFMSDIENKSFKIKLKSKYCYNKTGNIQLVLNRNKRCIEIHKVIQSKTKKNLGGTVIGIDKGYTTLLSCSDDKEYGQNMGDKFKNFSDFLNTRNKHRNYFIQEHLKLKKRLEEVCILLKSEIDEFERSVLLSEKSRLYRKITNLEEHNLGNKLYQKQHKRIVSNLEKQTNYYIKQMFRESNVYCFSKEDLSFTKSKNKCKEYNRILNTWLKGTLNKRLEYLASYYDIPFIDVNPAYTSQYCNHCHSKIKRVKEHYEIAICPNCGEINANINAAKNILDRKYDKQITLKTPCKDVKDILEKRYKA